MMSKGRNFITVALLVVSLVLTVLGVAAGEPDTVLGKAVNVCMECIGIG
ncbi:MAG: thioredoxin [Atopobiaceae bacterium]|nr:thioredoxin [Atopobiaceae bacterium]